MTVSWHKLYSGYAYVRIKWQRYKQADYNHSLGTVHETCCSVGSAGDMWSKAKCEMIWFHTLMLPCSLYLLLLFQLIHIAVTSANIFLLCSNTEIYQCINNRINLDVLLMTFCDDFLWQQFHQKTMIYVDIWHQPIMLSTKCIPECRGQILSKTEKQSHNLNC